MAELAQLFPTADPIVGSCEALIEAHAVGQRIRTLRLKRCMGLVELGRRTKLSPSFLSQIETGRVVPTLRNLARICLVFGKDLSYFFPLQELVSFRISRARDRVRLAQKQKNVPYLVTESLSSLIFHPHLIPEVTDFLPGAKGSALEPQKFPGVEGVFVIRGCLLALVAGEAIILEAADMLWVDAGVDRRYLCHGVEMTRALLLVMPTIAREQQSRPDKLRRSGRQRK